MDLGRYVATIEANIKNFESNIDKAEGLYKSFAEKQLAKEKQRFEGIKKVVEQETGIRVSSAKEIESATKNYNNAQINNIKKLASEYVTHGKQIERAEQSRARQEEQASERAERAKKKELETIEKAEQKRARQAEQASARVQKSLKKEQESVENLRKQILQWSSLAITVPIVFGTKKAMQDFIEFQNELYNVKAVTNATNAEMVKMTQTALEMSESFSKSGKEIATAFLQLGQAGYDASEILTSAKDVMLLSAAGMKDIDFTAELVVTTLKAFGMQASESSRVVDVFSSSAAKSVSSLDKISASLKYTAGLWGSQNWELEELVGLLDVLFDTGVRGEKAGRLLASAINGLQKPSSGASKEIEKLFGSVNALSPAMNDVTSIVKKLASANATTEQIFAIFGKESTDIMLRLIQNVENIDNAIAEVTGQSGETARQATVQMQSLGAQWDILKNKSTSFTKQVIGALEPMLVGLVKSAQGLLDVLNKLPDWLKTLLTLAATFTAFAPPVALAAVKLSGFAISLGLVKGAAITAGVALKAAFPILGAISLAVGGVALAYGHAQKKHQQWVDEVTSSIDKLEKQEKTLDEMVREVKNLYGELENTEKVKKSLSELALVFPEVRDAINKNADDTASAMSALYTALAKLNKEKANLAKEQEKTATTPQEQALAKQTEKLNKAEALFNKTMSSVTKNKGLHKDVLAIFTDGLKDYTDISSIQEATDYLRELINNTGEYGKAIDSIGLAMAESDSTLGIKNANDLLNFIETIQKATVEISKLQQQMMAPSEFKIEVTKDGQLQSALLDIVNELEKKYGSFDLEIFLDKANKEKIISEMGSVARAGLESLKANYSEEMKKIGILDIDGKWSESWGQFLTEGYEKVTEAFDGDINTMFSKLNEATKSAITGLSVAGLDDTKDYSVLLEGIRRNQQTINELDSKSTTYKADKLKLEQDIARAQEEVLKIEKEIPSETRDALRILASIYQYSLEMGEKGGTVSTQLDWWGKIKKEIEDIKSLLDGDLGITSLTETMNGFETKTGEGYKKVVELGTALATAFEKNPRLKWYAENFDIVNGVVTETTKKLEELELQQLRNAGIDTSIPEFIRDLKNAGDKVAQLKAQMKAIEVTPVPLDLQTVRNTIDDLRAELENSTPLNVDILLANAKEQKGDLVKLGLNDNEVNEELIKIYGKQVAELLKQEAIEKSLEEKYDSLKDKYGEGVVSLISKAEYNKAKDAEEALLVSIGKMSKEQAEANKAFRERNKILANNEAMNAMIKKAEEGKATYEELGIVMSTLGKDSSFSGMISDLEVYSPLLDGTKKKVIELKNALAKSKDSGDVIGSEKIEQELKEYEKKLKEMGENSIAIFTKMGTATLSIAQGLSNTVQKVKDLTKGLKDGTAEAIEIGDVIQDWGVALNGVTGGMSGLLSVAFEVFDVIDNIVLSIAEMIHGDKYNLAQNFNFEADAIQRESALEIENYLVDTYRTLGESIGSAISQGVSGGTVDIKDIVKQNLYNTLAASLIEAEGFADEITKLMKGTNLGGAILDKSSVANRIKELEQSLQKTGSSSTIQKQIDTYNSQLQSTNYDEHKKRIKSEVSWWRKPGEAIFGTRTKLAVAAAAEYNNSIKKLIAPLEQAKKEAKETENEIARLKKELAELSDIDTSANLDTTGIEEASAKLEKKLQDLYDKLGKIDNKEKLTKEISNSLQEALVNAALTGSYSDFKKAVYNILVSNITEALMSSAVIGARVQGLVAQVLNKATADGSELTMSDAKDILDEIQNVWKDVTDENTPIGSLLMGLRSGLSEFGEIDVSVNPGQVVTALPSDAMNKLDLAFQEVANRLSQAISEAGLNSQIDLVNITTAYIERMTATTVTIGSAVFDMSGDLVLNNINGDSVGEFLENVIKEQVEASLP